MDGSFYEQIIILLAVPPGNLVYHLVLAFSIAGALPGAINLWQRGVLAEGRRMVIGLSLLLLAQFVLIITAGFARFFPTLGIWLPILDRATSTFNLIIIGWLWIFPQKSRQGDSAATILSLIVLISTVGSGLWWLNQSVESNFNGSSVDLLWTGFSLLITLGAIVILTFRRPEGYGIGLGMFTLFFLGQLVYLISPLPLGDFPGIIRLSQIAAYPLLLTLPTRFSLPVPAEKSGAHSEYIEIFQNLETLFSTSKPMEQCQAITGLASAALNADICLMISPPDAKNHITLHCGYDLVRKEKIGTATFDSKLVPVLSESLRQGRPLHLPAEGNIPDLAGFEKILNIPISGSLLATPILAKSGDSDRALVLLSPYSERAWTAADQNYLADVADSLTEIFDYQKKRLSLNTQLAQSNKTIESIQAENIQLNAEIADLNTSYRKSIQKIQQLTHQLENLSPTGKEEQAK